MFYNYIQLKMYGQSFFLDSLFHNLFINKALGNVFSVSKKHNSLSTYAIDGCSYNLSFSKRA